MTRGIIREATTQHFALTPKQVVQVMDFDCTKYDGQISKIAKEVGHCGISVTERTLRKMYDQMKDALDAAQPAPLQATVTTPSIATPIQFLQKWLPGFVKVITAARNIDRLIGKSMVGAWEDEQIVQALLENLGWAVPYGDYTNTTFADWNPNYIYRTVVRFESGLMIGNLASARSARVNIDDAAQKREAIMQALEIIRNAIGFYGYNSGNNLTYGFLTDPGLPAYYTVAAGASASTLWANKTMLEIENDIRTAIAKLRLQSQDQIDPRVVSLTLGLPTSVVDYMSTSSNFNTAVEDWLTKSYPRVRVVSAPELVAANGSANVGYIFADRVDDNSTDNSQTFDQQIQTQFKVNGVVQEAKGFKESYSNATAGVMVKRPWAVIRFSGI